MSTVASLPALVKVHFVTGFLIVLLFPFSRLVHLIMFPIHYLWRPHQVVIWNRQPGRRAGDYPRRTAG
jgi:nitrate reductase gamma subunit